MAIGQPCHVWCGTRCTPSDDECVARLEINVVDGKLGYCSAKSPENWNIKLKCNAADLCMNRNGHVTDRTADDSSNAIDPFCNT